MNLPRHSITSHAITPVFVNAHFTSIKQNTDDKNDLSNNQGSKNKSKSQSRRKNESSNIIRPSFESTSKAKNDGERGNSSEENRSGKRDSFGRDDVDNRKDDDDDVVVQDDNYFACSTNQGFFVAKVDPFKMVVKRQFPVLQGGLAHVALIDDSSLMVLVGGGRVPRFAPNKVVLWDENLTFKIPIPFEQQQQQRNSIDLDDPEDALSEGTASPPPSTIFSLGREQVEMEKTDEEDGERIGEMGIDNEDEDDPESSKTDIQQSQSSISQAVENDKLLGMMEESETVQRTDSTHTTEEEHEEYTLPSSAHEEEEERNDHVQETAHEPEDTSASISLNKSVLGSVISDSANTKDPFAAPASPVGEVADDDSMDLGDSLTNKDNEQLPTAAPTEDAEQEYRVERGREVAELEFGEAVQNIRVESFNFRYSHDEEGDSSDKEEDQRRRTTKVALLIVTLQTKAIIFELGTHLPNEGGRKESLSNASWNVRQRLILDIHPDSSRCLPAIAQIEQTNCALIALPGRQNGHVQLVCVDFSNTGRTSLFPSSIAGASTIIAAHTNSIACLQLSKDGHYLCTASEKGTLLRLWSTFSGLGRDNRPSFNRNAGHSSRRGGNDRSTSIAASLLGELRRGSESAKILSIAFTPNKRFLAVASDKGTIHFFDLAALQGSLPFTTMSSSSTTGIGYQHSFNKSSSPSSFSSQTGIKFSQQTNRFLPSAIQNFAQQIPTSLLPQYFKSQWSFAQFRITLQIFSGRMHESMRYVKAPESKKTSKAKRSVIDGDDGDDDDLKHDQKSFIGDAFVPDRERNLEGGWAKMRGRVNDIRKGERTIQESIWLTWITKSVEEKDYEPFQLIAITSSGGLYRLAISTTMTASRDPSTVKSQQTDTSSSTILDMYRNDNSSSSDRQSASNEDTNLGLCSLIEHIRFGKQDEWLD